jgi:hypothetical protein
MFIQDFERTENSDILFGVIGRALVIATRFDSMCKSLAQAIDLKPAASLKILSDSDFDLLVEKTLRKHSNLGRSIKHLELPGDLSVILNDARNARNAVAHDLAVGLEGCIDSEIDEGALIRQTSDYVYDLAHGDLLISILIAEFNGEEVMRRELIPAYKEKILKWVIDK